MQHRAMKKDERKKLKNKFSRPINNFFLDKSKMIWYNVHMLEKESVN
jgi:hypothetical protein